MSFNSTVLQDRIELNWQTSKEESNDYFTLEKSEDGILWKELSKQNGAIRSEHILSYRFTDIHPIEGIQYYRLKQTDRNGSINVFPVITQEYKSVNPIEFTFFPNPATDHVTVNLPYEGEKRIRVFSLTGEIQFHELLFEGNQYLLDLNQFNPGNYLLEVSYDNFIERKKLRVN